MMSTNVLIYASIQTILDSVFGASNFSIEAKKFVFLVFILAILLL